MNENEKLLLEIKEMSRKIIQLESWLIEINEKYANLKADFILETGIDPEGD